MRIVLTIRKVMSQYDKHWMERDCCKIIRPFHYLMVLFLQ